MLSPNSKDCYYDCGTSNLNRLLVYGKKYSINSMNIFFLIVK